MKESTIIACPQCGNDAEIHEQPNGNLLCEVCGWIVKYSNKDGSGNLQLITKRKDGK